MSLINLGLLAYDQGEYPQAQAYLTESLSSWKAMEHAPETASVLRHLGQVCLARGEAHQEEAIGYLASALRLASRHQLAPVALDAFTWVALLLMHFDESRRAVELLYLAESHPSSTYETKQRAAQQRAVLERADPDLNLSERVAAESGESERQPDWQTVAEQIRTFIEALLQHTHGG